MRAMPQPLRYARDGASCLMRLPSDGAERHERDGEMSEEKARALLSMFDEPQEKKLFTLVA